ncbi:MAG: LysM peptidoglycan-binding domain-containing protein [Aggregatilineales bacterium]
MAGRDILEAFNDCVDRLARGEGIEDCLRAYPQFAAELAPMLETGLLVRRIDVRPEELQPSQERVRFRLEHELARAPLVQPSTRWTLRYVAGWIITFALVLMLISSGTAIYAQNSLPGDALYGYKRFSENVRLSLAPLPFTADADALNATFAEERRDEVREVVAIGREVEVEFEGVVEAVGDVTVLVSGFVLRAEFELLDFVIGERVNVRARSTADGELIAISITRRNASSINMPQPTQTPAPVEPTQTGTPTPRPTNTDTPTREIRPTETQLRPTEALTATPSRQSQTPVTVSSTACVISAPAGWMRYTIQSGDTLSSLAARTNTSVQRIMTVNCLENANVLTVGRAIFLPNVTDSPQNPTVTPIVRDGGNANSGGNGEATTPPQRDIPPTATRQNNNGGGRGD